MSSYKYFEEYNQPVTDSLIGDYGNILSTIGEDVNREGILKTPERAAKAIQFLTSGNCQDPAEILKSAMFAESYHDMVVIKDIELYSLCEHHILPFFWKSTYSLHSRWLYRWAQ
jgi:GTP cyclohydrolase I